MTLVILDFQNTFEPQSFYQAFPHEFLDLHGIPGTNRYCEDEAVRILSEKLCKHPLKAVHMLGSGNYHYVTEIWTSFLECPFQLLVYDHHTDMQPPAFGDILSCGGWLLKALEINPWLRKVILAGPEAEAYEQTPPPARGKVSFISMEKLSRPDGSGWREILAQIDPELPLYLSVDKDILGKAYAHTSWSQGVTSREELLMSIEDVLSRHVARGGEILGVDICGEAEEADPDLSGLNEAANIGLVSLLKQYI